MRMLAYVLARFSEPSSYAGLGALLALAGFHFADTTLGQLVQFLAAGCALAALFLKERGLIQMIAVALLLGSALGACSSADAPAQARVVLTTTQQAMCEAQSAANIASAVAQAAGDASAATEASKASAVAGVGCTWTNPTSATPAT